MSSTKPSDNNTTAFRPRVLSVIGFAHSQGVIHGNIDPAHLLIRGEDHNVTVLDWSNALLSETERTVLRRVAICPASVQP